MLLAASLRTAGIEGWHEEYQFHPTRRWRFDFAWPDHRLSLEVEGGVWSGGRHTRGAGFVADCEKYNAATLAGWRVLRVVPRAGWIEEAISLVEEALKQ
jgi:very-short-patch-repair endonuclease